MKLAKLFILLAILCLAHTVCASTVRVNSTGAAKRTINLCALRDKYGFLWVGTTTGLACFDGNGRPVNNTHSGILRPTSNLRVTNIFEYGDNLLFATPNQLMLFDRSKMTTYRMPVHTKYDVEISSQVNNICKGADNNDDLWIATQGQGLFRYNPTKQELIQYSQQGSFFTDVILSDDGFVYAAGINGEIHKYSPRGECVATSRIPDYTSSKAFINLVATGNRIWISSGSDIYCMDASSGQISFKTSAPAIISSIIRYDTTKLMLGTSSGVMEYDTVNNSLAPVKEAEMGLKSNSNSINVKINQLTNDTDGGILTVRQSGEILEIYDSTTAFDSFVPITQRYDDNKFVYALSADNRRNGLWVGSDNGLNYYDASTGILSAPVVPSLDNEPITSITTDGEKVWIGTANNGLFLYNSSTGQSRHFKNDINTPYTLPSDEINDVFVTTRGVTYVSTHWGICRYNPARNEFNTLPEIGQQTEVISMAEYYDGVLWAATVNNGLLYLKPDKTRFESFRSRNLENITVNTLLMSRNGTLWAATQSYGLFFYNKDINDFESYKLPLLTNRSILALQEDNNGALWIVTDESIIKISKDGQIDSNYKYHTPSMALTQPMVLMQNGDMVLGSSNGFYIFNSSQISQHKNVATYPTTLAFPLEDDNRTRNQLGLSILLYTTDRITLPYDHNSFTIYLAANHPTDMPTITYDYMLEGLDKDWNIGALQSEVTYNNISPGTYSFMVRPSGLTDVETKKLSITISSPWYLSTWACTVYFILLLLVAMGISQLVKIRVRKHYARRMESLKIQREREAWESKMRFFVDLVHEIRTPLMLISLPLEQLLKRFKNISADTEPTGKDDLNRELNYGKKYLGAMQTNLDYLLGITNEILDFRKIENETEQTLHLSPCNVNLLIEDLRDRFEEPMETENKRLVIDIPSELIVADIDRTKTDRVLMNLVGNARKYCKTTTEIKLDVEDGNVVITISDDGPGIPEKERSHIFDLYYQIKDDEMATSLGTGLGLAYARLIAHSHGGEITVGHTPGGGAQFKLSLPMTATAKSIRNPEHNSDYKTSGVTVPDENEGKISIDENNENGNTKENLTVLIVDDNKELLEMISDGLNSKYHVITASDGIEALEKLKDNDIDFIVSDVMMPRMNGMKLLQKVKENINTSHIPFIILTAKTTRESKEEGMENGADIYLDKPFSIRALIYQIENIRRTRQYFYARRRGTEPLSLIDADEKDAIEENKLPAMSKYDSEFLDKMEAVMAENISDDQFSIDSLAERLNMSRSSFYRKIKALMGMTPVDYMKNYRLDAAARQLREKVRVNEVVANVGFTSHSYFAKCFKEKYGVLPRDYVDSLKDV